MKEVYCVKGLYLNGITKLEKGKRYTVEIDM